MSHCFPGLDIHDSSAPPPPPPPSLTTNILAADDVPSCYISSPVWEKPRSAGTLESVVNQSIISHHRHHKSAGDGGNYYQPAAVIATDALIVPACDNNNIHTYNYHNNNNQEKPKHMTEFIPEEEPYSGAAGGGTKHGSAGVCSCKSHSSRRRSRCQSDSGKKGENRKSVIPTNKCRVAANAMHNQSEKKRREKINQRMKILQKIVPNCSKTNKASVLDDAIEYLKLLQEQVQMMSMMMNMMPSMMLPHTMQQHLQMSTMGIDTTGCAATLPPSDVQHALSLVMPDFMSAFVASQSQSTTIDAYYRMATFYQQLQQSPTSGSNN